MNSTLSSITGGHLPNGVLVQLLDDELSSVDAAKAERHLAICGPCSARYAELRKTSSSFDEFIDSLRPVYELSDRQELASKLDRVDEGHISPIRARRVTRLHWWGLTAAAALAVGVLYLPLSLRDKGQSQTMLSPDESTSAFEIDGETFISLPFSNPELPINARRIVQMQVPIASLAEAGIVVEPIANRVAQPDRSVLADVLLGLDGQPVAVHVVSSD
ncbi:MAG: anti-sigma factor family protein [Bryobacteraceae bacterium]